MTDRDFARRWQRRFTERGARLDDDAGIAGWTETGLAARLRQFTRLWRAAAPAGTDWLDLGCGAGSYARLLHGEGRRVVGLDYALPSLGKAQQRSPGGIAWVAGDAQRLPFADAAFDGVLCFGVMQALPGSDDALAEIRRVLRPGGEAWVDALNAGCLPTRIQEWLRRRAGRAPHLRYETREALRGSARRAGLEVRAEHWLPLVPGRLSVCQGPLESRPAQVILLGLPWVGELLSHSFLLCIRLPEPGPRALPTALKTGD